MLTGRWGQAMQVGSTWWGGACGWGGWRTPAHGTAPARATCHRPAAKVPWSSRRARRAEPLCNRVFRLLPASLVTPDGNLEQATAGENPHYNFQARTGHSTALGSPGPRPRWRKHYFLVLFWGASVTMGHPCCASSTPSHPARGCRSSPHPCAKKFLPTAPRLCREETHAKEAPMFLQLM